MAAPNLERMYECGDALANVKDKNFAEVTIGGRLDFRDIYCAFGSSPPLLR